MVDHPLSLTDARGVLVLTGNLAEGITEPKKPSLACRSW